MKITNKHKALITAAVPEVTFDGWTWKALERAADSLDMHPLIARDYFPGGGADMIMVHSLMADEAMVEVVSKEDLAELGIKGGISAVLMARFKANQESREAIRRAVALLAQPSNTGLATKLLLKTVGAVWVAVGDKSEDYNYYSKRALLAGVYSATLLVWLDDESEDLSDTKAFLERRLSGVVSTFGKIGKLRSAFAKHFPNLPDPLGWVRAPTKD
ncbi:COQ9 family protein [Alphaproteobacteria bacterium]|nr:COQ9 family protein [Alphaproteobacteria bacterium]